MEFAKVFCIVKLVTLYILTIELLKFFVTDEIVQLKSYISEPSQSLWKAYATNIDVNVFRRAS